MKLFMTFNPHIENLSQNNLLNNFKVILKKYYRKKLGSRYYKHKDKQYQIGIFQEVGSKDFKQPYLHIIVDVPLTAMQKFYNFLKTYHQLMTYNKKYTCIMKDGQIVFNNH